MDRVGSNVCTPHTYHVQPDGSFAPQSWACSALSNSHPCLSSPGRVALPLATGRQQFSSCWFFSHMIRWKWPTPCQDKLYVAYAGNCDAVLLFCCPQLVHSWCSEHRNIKKKVWSLRTVCTMVGPCRETSYGPKETRHCTVFRKQAASQQEQHPRNKAVLVQFMFWGTNLSLGPLRFLNSVIFCANNAAYMLIYSTWFATHSTLFACTSWSAQRKIRGKSCLGPSVRAVSNLSPYKKTGLSHTQAEQSKFKLHYC